MAPKRKATIIALANQKGGVAKTTSVASLGAAFAEQGRRVLLVDLDPQACLTFSLGVDPDTVESSVHDVLVGGVDLADVIVAARRASTSCPARSTSPAPRRCCSPGPPASTSSRAHWMPSARDYDVILLDCSPSLGVLTLNALTAAHGPRHPDALRDAQPPWRRPAARHRARRQADPQQEAARPRHPPHPLRRAQHPLARGARGRRRALWPAGSLPADPEDGAVRRGAGRRSLDPVDGADAPRAPPPTARSPAPCSPRSDPHLDRWALASRLACHRHTVPICRPRHPHSSPTPPPPASARARSSGATCDPTTSASHRVRRHLPLRHPHRARGVGCRPLPADRGPRDRGHRRRRR